MAKTDKNILNIGKFYNILSQIKTKISERFTAVDTAISGKKNSGESSITNNDAIQTIKKIVLDANGNIVSSGTNKTEFQPIANATDPKNESSHISNTQGLVKLQDIINPEETNTTNAVTPHAVSEAIKGFSSYIDASWILVEKCTDYTEGFHELLLNNDEYDRFMDVMQSIKDCKLVIGNNADGTWVGTSSLNVNVDMTYPGAEWVPFILISALDPTVQTNYKLTFTRGNSSIKYNFSAMEASTEVYWSDIIDHPSIPSIIHQEYKTGPYVVDTLKFAGNQYYSTEVICESSSHSTPKSIGLLVPAPSNDTRKNNNVLKLNSTGKLIWGFPLPSYNANTDSNKVLRIVPNSGGDFKDIAWTDERTKAILVDVTDMTADEAGSYCDQYSNGTLPYLIQDYTIMHLSSIDETGSGGSSGSHNYLYYSFMGFNYKHNKTYCKKLTKYTFTPTGASAPSEISYTWDRQIEDWYTNFGGVNAITPSVYRFGNASNSWDWTIPTDSLKNYCENYIHIDNRSYDGEFCHEFLWQSNNTGGNGPFTVDLPKLYGNGQQNDFTIVIDNESGNDLTIVPFDYAYNNIIGTINAQTSLKNGSKMLVEVRGITAKTFILS